MEFKILSPTECQQIEAIYRALIARLELHVSAKYQPISKAAGKDLIDAVFIKFIEHVHTHHDIDRFQITNTFRYLCRMIYNYRIDLHRRDTLQREFESGVKDRIKADSLKMTTGNASPLQYEEEYLRKIDEILRKHPRADKTDRYIARLTAQGHSAKEVAAFLGNIKAPAVRYRRRKIQEILRPHFPPPPRRADSLPPTENPEDPPPSA